MAKVIELSAYRSARNTACNAARPARNGAHTVEQSSPALAPLSPTALRQAELHLHSAIALLQESPEYARVSWLLEECYELLTSRVEPDEASFSS